MGETIKEVKTESMVLIHVFHCDICNKYLGECAEDEDDYVEVVGEFEHKIFFADKWWTKQGFLCEEHHKAFTNDFIAAIQSFGYVSDK